MKIPLLTNHHLSDFLHVFYFSNTFRLIIFGLIVQNIELSDLSVCYKRRTSHPSIQTHHLTITLVQNHAQMLGSYSICGGLMVNELLSPVWQSISALTGLLKRAHQF